MSDAEGRVIGIRLRLQSGRKLAVTGGREGIFAPADLAGTSPLLICEGPTDTAAMLDLGFGALGRPSCVGGARFLVKAMRRTLPRAVAILADADPPGQRGADRLAGALAAYCPIVRVVTPPEGIKDGRDWKNAGATHSDVLDAIEASALTKLSIVVRPTGRHGLERGTHG